MSLELGRSCNISVSKFIFNSTSPAYGSLEFHIRSAGHGAASWAVGDGSSARGDGDGLGDVSGALSSNHAGEGSNNNGETHLD